MSLEDASNQVIFTLKSPFSQSEKNSRKLHYQKHRSKDLRIIHKGTPVSCLHTLFLDSDFDATLALFSEGPEVVIPEQMDISQNIFEVITNYFYFQEIQGVFFAEIFDLLKLAFFLMIDLIITKVKVFLKENLTEVKKASFILKNANDFIYLFGQNGAHFLRDLIEKTYDFLLKGSYFDEFFEIFDSRFFETNSEKIPEIFESQIKELKCYSAPNETLMKFIQIFNEPLLSIEKNEEKSSSEEFFHKYVEKHVDFTKVPLDQLTKFLKILNIDSNDLKMKVLMENNIENRESVIKLEIESQFLSQKVEETKEDLEKMKGSQEFLAKTLQDYEDLKEEFEECKKSLKNAKCEIKELKHSHEEKTDILRNQNIKLKDEVFVLNRELFQIKQILSQIRDKTSFFLWQTFPNFNEKVLLFDSTKDEIGEITKKVEGKMNTVFIIEPSEENLVFGAYYSIPLPEIDPERIKYHRDERSCMFEINSGRIYKANPNKSKQLSTQRGFFITLGIQVMMMECIAILRMCVMGKELRNLRGRILSGFR